MKPSGLGHIFVGRGLESQGGTGQLQRSGPTTVVPKNSGREDSGGLEGRKKVYFGAVLLFVARYL